MKRFMYFSISVLCLSLSALVGFHIGGQSAEAQTPSNIIAFGTDATYKHHFVMDQNGNVWSQIPSWPGVSGCGANRYLAQYCEPARFVGNFWTGDTAPVSVSPETWGGIKGKYDDKK